MDKVIRNGMVAVLYSPGFGAGWSTWNSEKGCEFNPRLVAAVEAGASGPELTALAHEVYPDLYCGGARNLKIEWLPQGTSFYIDVYDGSESVRTSENLTEVA